MLPQYLLALFLSSINQIQQQPEKHQKKSSIVDISSWKNPKYCCAAIEEKYLPVL